MKTTRQIKLLIVWLFLGFGTANAQTGASSLVYNTEANFSCPGQVTVTYDLGVTCPANMTLYYSHNKIDWLIATTVTGDLTAQTAGTGKTIVWNNYEDNVLFGNFYFKIEATALDGVMINGVCWAKQNVGMPGTFNSTGRIYQWNREKAWPASGMYVTDWDASFPTGTTWEKENDPCPAGWRVPTRSEFQSLHNAGRVSWALNGNRYRFTDKTTGGYIDLPVIGFRHAGGGGMDPVVDYSSYWSSTQSNNRAAYVLFLHTYTSGLGDFERNYGFCVRCVAE